MKQRIVLLFLLLGFFCEAQDSNPYEKPPVFSECSSKPIDSLNACFNFALNTFIFQNFKVPDIVNEESYRGDVQILFEVDTEGKFQVLYIDAIYNELKDEVKRVFGHLPKIQPATYNGNPTFVQYSLALKIPLVQPQYEKISTEQATESKKRDLTAEISNEIDSVNNSIVPYKNLEYKSQLNIPFTHTYYARFDAQMNKPGTNSHTAAKPFLFDEVSPYYDVEAEKESLAKDKEGWWGRKLWNEHMVQVQTEDYWFVLDPILDLQVGRDTEADFSSTYNNTRGIWIQGGLGKKFNFSASVYESQGRFAQYFNQFAESIRASGPDPAIIPGRGIAKRFKTNSYDYPVAEAYISYTPAKFVNLQFGHGKNFIGDGYRSLLQSDVTSPYPFLKTNFKFWKIKYTSTWMWLRDVRDEVIEDGAFLPKYMANHYLSWNVSKRLNIGLFEAVMWADDNGRGFDVNYLNPLIFFRAIEFETGQDAGNAILGLSGKYKWNNRFNIYGQFIVDEFSLEDVREGNKSWKNKFGFQLGVKYYNAFNVDNLLLQAEYNQVRPYTYSHNSIVLNYAHNNQSMAHLWGANFREFVLIGRYNYERWFADAKIIIGERGFDFNTDEDSFNYGGNIYRTENDRVGDTNITIGQGNNTTVFHGELYAGYIINPVTNLKLFANISYRNFDPTTVTAATLDSNTVWFNIGLRTDLFNWYI
ncbi:MAG: gliding motility protein RemB, partial [Bacteroidota bacterium]